MSDPVRWKDGGGGPDGAKDLLRSAPGPRPMTAAERARTAARLSKIGAAGGSGAGGAATGAAWGKGLALAAGAGAIGLLARALLPAADVHAPAPNVPVETAADPAPRPSEPVPEGTPGGFTALSPPAASTSSSGSPRDPGDAPRAAATSAVGPRRGTPPSPAPRPRPRETVNPLLEEAEGLERARVKLASDPATSLDLLRAHLRRFPAGQLAAERDYLTIDALVRLGRRDEARAQAHAFLLRHPASPYAKELERALLTNP